MSDPFAGNSETISSEDPATRSGGSSKKKLTAGLAAAAVVAAVAGGGVYAYTMLSSSGDYPYDHLADGAFAYGQTNIDPSADQKLAINDLVKKFPEAKGEDGFKELTSDNINGAFLASAIGHEGELKWVGDRMAIAAYPDDDDEGTEPEIAILIETTDAKAAEKDLKKIQDAANETETEVADDELSMDGVQPASFEAEETSEEEFVGKVYDEKWVGLTNGDPAAMFEADKTLADNEGFTDDFDSSKGNVVGVWADLAGFADALKADGEEEVPDMTGSFTSSLSARKDGLDLKTNTFGVKVDGKVFGPKGDASGLADLLTATSYDDAFLNLAVAGLGESAKTAAEGLGEDDMISLSDGYTPEDLKGLLGDKAALSLAGEDLENLDGKLVLEGIDRAAWEKMLAEEDLTVDEVDDVVTGIIGLEATFTLEDDTVSLQVGGEPQGSGSFEDGVVTGSIDLDGVVGLFNDFASSFEGEEAPETPKDLGVIEFHSDADENGDGESVISWTTPR